MTTELTTQETGNLVGIADPNGILDAAINAAKALSRVVSQKKKPVIMNGEQYLEFEDWQTLGQFYGVTVKTGEAVMVDIGGVKGAKARADLISLRTGQIIGGAEAYCMRDEDKWSTRPKYEYRDNERVKIGDEPVPWFQLASMAQTRAGAKALRNRLAWIAVLAGYRPTPAEEMTGTEVQHDQSGHWCKLHNTAFFMRGKMKSFAHPIGKTGEWCHEHTDEKEEIKEDKAPETATPESDKPPEPPQEAPPAPTVGFINKEWLDASLKTMNWKTEKTVTTWIHGKVKDLDCSGKLSDVLGRMTKEQAEVFTKELQELVDMK